MKRPTLITPDGANILSPAQQECISLLEQLLDSAKGGNINALCVVAVGPVDFGVAMAGSDAPKLFLGCGVAMDTIKARATGGDSPPRTVLHR